MSNFATIAEVFADGVTLIFDEQPSEATTKHYKVNTSITFTAGDRVKICEDSGTYVVEYVVGNPNADVVIPAGGTNGQVLTKNGANDFASKWATPASSGGLPTGGTSGQFLKKNSATDYDASWAAAPTDGCVLKSGAANGYVPVGSNAGSYSWGYPPTLGNYNVGFFGSAGSSQKWISNPTSSNYLSVLQDLVSALKAYNLIH